MQRKTKPTYFFRGTTIGWEGNSASRQLPRTPTTTNPVKALMFALCCRDKRATAVIYIAKAEKLKGIPVDKNVLARVEEEIGFMINPVGFVSLCEGYLLIPDAILIINKLGIDVPPFHDRSMLDFALKGAPHLDEHLTERFYVLQNHCFKLPKFVST